MRQTLNELGRGWRNDCSQDHFCGRGLEFALLVVRAHHERGPSLLRLKRREHADRTRPSRSPMRARSKSSPSSASRYSPSASSSGSLTSCDEVAVADQPAPAQGGGSGRTICHDLLPDAVRRGLCRQLSLHRHVRRLCLRARPRSAVGTARPSLRHLLYNSGRLTTYCFLGGLAGALGQVICTPQGTTVIAAGRLARRRPANPRDCRRAAHDRDGAAVLRPAAGAFIALRSASAAARFATVAAQPADDPQPRGAARLWGVQRLPAVSAGLCLRRRGGEHRPKRFPAFSPWRRLDWGPSRRC